MTRHTDSRLLPVHVHQPALQTAARSTENLCTHTQTHTFWHSQFPLDFCSLILQLNTRDIALTLNRSLHLNDWVTDRMEQLKSRKRTWTWKYAETLTERGCMSVGVNKEEGKTSRGFGVAENSRCPYRVRGLGVLPALNPPDDFLEQTSLTLLLRWTNQIREGLFYSGLVQHCTRNMAAFSSFVYLLVCQWV